MSFYGDMAATALTLLEEFGQAVTLIRKTGGKISPVLGETIPQVEGSVLTTGIIKRYKDSMIDGVRILSGDRELVLSNEQIPVQSDRVTIGTENWSIINIDTIKPAGTPIVYFCQVRK